MDKDANIPESVIALRNLITDHPYELTLAPAGTDKR